jgi:hypothetical protein
MAGALRPDECTARRALDLLGHLGHHRLDAGIGFGVAARHHAGAFQRPFLAAGDAHADEAKTFFLERVETPVGVGEERIAAVDDDVALVQMRSELGDDVVHRLARLDQYDDRAGPGQRGHERRDGLGWNEAALRPMLADQLVGPCAVAIVDRHAEPLSGRVAGQIGPHRREAEHSDIGEVRHGFLSL